MNWSSVAVFIHIKNSCLIILYKFAKSLELIECLFLPAICFFTILQFFGWDFNNFLVSTLSNFFLSPDMHLNPHPLPEIQHHTPWYSSTAFAFLDIVWLFIASYVNAAFITFQVNTSVILNMRCNTSGTCVKGMWTNGTSCRPFLCSSYSSVGSVLIRYTFFPPCTWCFVSKYLFLQLGCFWIRFHFFL